MSKEQKYKDKFIPTGELNISSMIRDVIRFVESQ